MHHKAKRIGAVERQFIEGFIRPPSQALADFSTACWAWKPNISSEKATASSTMPRTARTSRCAKRIILAGSSSMTVEHPAFAVSAANNVIYGVFPPVDFRAAINQHVF